MMTILRFFQGIASRSRAIFYGLLGVKFEGRSWLRLIEIPRGHRDIRIADGVQLDRGVVLLVSGESERRGLPLQRQAGTAAAHVSGSPLERQATARDCTEKIVIGRAAYINRATMIDASERIEIGANCMIGPFCYITDHDHAAGSADELISKPTRIGERVWLGAHVTVLKGVSIGDGSVVGAGSVVTKSLPARVVAVGNPARVIREIAP